MNDECIGDLMDKNTFEFVTESKCKTKVDNENRLERWIIKKNQI